jgi:hypothetical protein
MKVMHHLNDVRADVAALLGHLGITEGTPLAVIIRFVQALGETDEILAQIRYFLPGF